MDAQQTAEARIELVERRLTALQEAGVDTAGLASRLDVARRALTEGRSQEVPTLCEDILADARRLIDGGARSARAPRTERLRTPLPIAPVAAEPPPAPMPPAAPPVDRDAVVSWVQPHLLGLEARLDERINQLAPLITAIGTQVAQRPELDHTLIEQAVEQSVAPLLAQVQAQIAEQFTRLSATETRTIPRPGLSEEDVSTLIAQALGGIQAQLEMRPAAPSPDLSALEERLATSFDRRLDARLAAVTAHTAESLEGLRHDLADQGPITPPTTKVRQVLASTMPEATAAAVDQALEPLEARIDQRLSSMAETVGTLEVRIGDLGAGLEQRLEVMIAGQVDRALGERLTQAVADGLSGIDASVAATVRDLVGQALEGAQRPDTQTIRNQVAADMRADLDFQMEQMAAEKGWVSINDVRAEVASHSPVTPNPAMAAAQPGFARLEAALVEFVRQTQTQQARFLDVLQEKVVRGTAQIAQQAMTSALARIPGNRISPSSEAVAAPGGSLDPLDPVPTPSTRSTEQVEIPSDAWVAADAPNTLPLDDIHSDPTTRTLNALARGNAPTDEHAVVDEKQPVPADPDLPPVDDLDVMSQTSQHAALRESQATVVAISAPSADIQAAVAAAGGSAVPVGSDLDADLLEDSASVNEHGSTRIEAAAAHDELSSEVLQMDPIEAPHGADPVLGLDDHETASFQDTETLGDVAPPIRLPDPVTTDIPSDAGTETPQPMAEKTPLAVDAPPVATPPVTRRERSPAAIEQALRELVGNELDQRLSAGIPALTQAIQAAVAAAMADHRAQEAAHLEETIRTLVRSELDLRAPDPARDLATLAEVLRTQAGRPAGPADLRGAVLDLLQDGAVRQAVLEIVALEAIANPGPLAEMTGLRAFIRREVQQAAGAHDDLPTEAVTGA